MLFLGPMSGLNFSTNIIQSCAKARWLLSDSFELWKGLFFFFLEISVIFSNIWPGSFPLIEMMYLGWEWVDTTVSYWPNCHGWTRHLFASIMTGPKMSFKTFTSNTDIPTSLIPPFFWETCLICWCQSNQATHCFLVANLILCG